MPLSQHAQQRSLPVSLSVSPILPKHFILSPFIFYLRLSFVYRGYFFFLLWKHKISQILVTLTPNYILKLEKILFKDRSRNAVSGDRFIPSSLSTLSVINFNLEISGSFIYSTNIYSKCLSYARHYAKSSVPKRNKTQSLASSSL